MRNEAIEQSQTLYTHHVSKLIHLEVVRNFALGVLNVVTCDEMRVLEEDLLAESLDR